MKTPARTVAAVAFVAAAILVEKLLWPALALPSITSLIVVADLLARWAGVPFLRREERRLLLVCAAVVGVVLYAMTLALIRGDLYRLGFSPFAPIVLAIGAAIAAKSYPRLSISVLIVLIAFDVRLLRSANLFDYLVDPLLTLAALVWCALHAWRAVKSWRRREEKPFHAETRRRGE
jgi:hypothetical protein